MPGDFRPPLSTHLGTSPVDAVRLIARVEDYFGAVDRKDLAGALAFFAEDATVTIATFDLVYQGRDTSLRGMFERLFMRYEAVWHGDFDHVAAPPYRIATRFQVRNTSAIGQQWNKHNCNFFRLRDDELFQDVQIFMSGDNALA